MTQLVLLSKIVAVSADIDLSCYPENYYPEIGLYLFFSEAYYDPVEQEYSGRKLLHDQLIAKYHLESIPTDKRALITVDIKSTDQFHSYMHINRRGLKLTEDQIDYIGDLFEVDFVQLKVS